MRGRGAGLGWRRPSAVCTGQKGGRHVRIFREGQRLNRAERSMSLPHYRLRCRGCDETFEDDGFALECSTQHDEPTLLVPEYRDKRFEPDMRSEGMFRYRKWLPGTRTLSGAGSSVTYKSERLNRLVGLSNLWVVFNGYWPEKGATLETTTFKELEAWSVLSRVPEQHEGVLVVASAGNTAAAFARACSLNRIPCLIVIPEAGLPCLRVSDGRSEEHTSELQS